MARTPKRKPGYRPRVAGTTRRPNTEQWKPASSVPTPEVAPEPDVEVTSSSPEVADTTEGDAAAIDPGTADTAKTDTAETDTVETDAAETDTAASETVVIDTGKTDTGKTDIGKADTGKADTGKADTATTDTAKTAAGSSDTTVSMTKPTTDRDATSERPRGKSRPVARVSTIRPSDTPTTPRSPSREKAGPGRRRPTAATARRSVTARGWFTRSTVTVLGAVTVVLAVVALLLAWYAHHAESDNRAFVDESATAELLSQTSTKICVTNAANGLKFDEWSKNALANLTGEARSDFEKVLAGQRKTLIETQSVTDCHVDAVGVRDLTGNGDGASATVVVNMTISGTRMGVMTQSLSPRYQVTMTKHGEQWLIAKVDDIDPAA